MSQYTSTAQAHPNIAFIKFWGNKDATLNIPASGSISMNLDALVTRTSVIFDPSLPEDELVLNGQNQRGAALQRVSVFIQKLRALAKLHFFARIESENDFPTGAGIASSASAFAALSLAASRAAGLQLNEKELSRLARNGSGSACRSVPAGFVEWQAGSNDVDSYAYSLAQPEHWALTDCIAVVNAEHKPITSSQGHLLADSSPFQPARIANAVERLHLCRQAIVERDFSALAHVAELDCLMMHAVMMTSQPSLLYWSPTTVAIISSVQSWRQNGLDVFYTIDAGPNVHVICPSHLSGQVTELLHAIPGIHQVLTAEPGGPACWLAD